MKRDPDVIRAILLGMEADDAELFFLEDAAGFACERDDLGGVRVTQEAVGHVILLHSAGFLSQSQSGAYRITWAGYEFLETVRDPEIWKKTKEGAAKVGTWSIVLLGELAKGYAKAKAIQLGLPVSA